MTAIRTRREPEAFRRVEVARVEPRGLYMTRITLTGPELAGLDVGLPAASVRLLLPLDTQEVVLPVWNGNEFLLEDGSRPIIRTLTLLPCEPGSCDLDVDVVRHGHGPLSAWADEARAGDRVAVSGTGRGYDIEPAARSFLLAGDESALPAISVLLRALPPCAEVRVLVEVQHVAARLDLPAHPGAVVQWYDSKPVRVRVMPSSPLSPARGWIPTSEYGPRARPRPCNASADISSMSVACRARAPRSGAKHHRAGDVEAV